MSRNHLRALAWAAFASLLALAPIAAPAAVLPGANAAQAVRPLAAHAAPSPAGQATMAISSITPDVITASSAVTITGTITNTGAAPMASGEIDLQLAEEAVPASRATLAKWAAAAPIDNWGWTAAATKLSAPIEVGGSQPFTIQVPASRLALPASAKAWGPYLARIDFATPTGIVAVQRTFLLWRPVASVPGVSLATLVPLLASPREDLATTGQGLASPQSITQARATVEAGAGGPIDWLVDPALLAAGVKDEETGRLAAVLSQAASAHDVYHVPWGDADLGALADAGSPALYQFTLTAGEQAMSGAKVADSGLLLWPAHGQITPGQAGLINTGPTPSSVLLSSAAAAKGAGESVPSSARALITDDAGTLPGVITDDQLSALLTTTDTGSALGRQRLAAELAAISATAGGQNTSLLLVPPRDWAGSADRLARAVQYATSLPWTSAEATHNVLLSDVSGNQVVPGASDDTEGELRPNLVRQLDAALTAAGDYAVATDQPGQVLAPLARSLMFPLSTSLRAFTHARARDLYAAIDQTDKVTGTISLKQGSAVNLISSSGMMPVSVTNNGAHPVTLTLKLVSPDYRLQADDSKALTVQPGTEARTQLAVKAVASGNVTLQVLAVNKYGHELAPRSSVTVRVRADWEDLGTLAVGLGLAALLIVGLFRSRRRKRAPKEQPGT